jgi:hypothetical protein
MNTYQSCANTMTDFSRRSSKRHAPVRVTSRRPGSGWAAWWSPDTRGVDDGAGWANENDSLDVLYTVEARNSDDFHLALMPPDIDQPCAVRTIANYFG